MNQPDPPAAASTESKAAPVLATEDAKDIHSYARPLEARVTHVALDLAVDFAAKSIGGTATLDIERKPDAKEIVLDSRGLRIAAVADQAGRPLQWKIGPTDANLGEPVAITLRPDTSKIAIRYLSAAAGGALQWLTPEQTAGKQHPYLFSQGQ
ncbi:MAG: hypothetical protein ABIP91_06215 [Sphingomicrobium sp.]